MHTHRFVGGIRNVGTVAKELGLFWDVASARVAASRRSARPLYCPAIMVGAGWMGVFASWAGAEAVRKLHVKRTTPYSQIFSTLGM